MLKAALKMRFNSAMVKNRLQAWKVELSHELRNFLQMITGNFRHGTGEETTPPGAFQMACPTCGVPITSNSTPEEELTHNPRTCLLVNTVLAETGVGLERQIRVEIYPGNGQLGGFYTTADPYTIHISDQAYMDFPEYIIFHETKHMVDCLTKGWSEEGTPDDFARTLCVKYGYRWPPPQQPTPIIFNGMWF